METTAGPTQQRLATVAVSAAPIAPAVLPTIRAPLTPSSLPPWRDGSLQSTGARRLGTRARLTPHSHPERLVRQSARLVSRILVPARVLPGSPGPTLPTPARTPSPRVRPAESREPPPRGDIP